MDILPSVAGIDGDTAILVLLYMLVLMIGAVFTALISGLLFLCLVSVIGAFTFFGIDLCKNLEEFFDQRNQKWLATGANSMAKAVCGEDEKQKQVTFLNKKKALLQEGRVLAQRDVYQTEEIKDLEEIEDLGKKPIPSQQEKLEKHRQESKEASDLLFKNWRQYKDLLHECPGGAWIREDERNQSSRQTSQEEKTACKYRKVVVVVRRIELSLETKEKDLICISTRIARQSAHAVFAESPVYLVVKNRARDGGFTCTDFVGGRLFR
ncbi:uncharacterized protein N7503_000508 [Penicillium pulvis]|uniref:uncharacterized protein n=1 Tax=Penicillium pulvis TaxID=1562058 RepID=UPI002549A6C4|nr:uncharacterized protein N7503_000508 [Penicillium pulvis]KAJ5813758.1 hypothetical protein N7503_000508 [Penicillium pulvis]